MHSKLIKIWIIILLGIGSGSRSSRYATLRELHLTDTPFAERLQFTVCVGENKTSIGDRNEEPESREAIIKYFASDGACAAHIVLRPIFGLERPAVVHNVNNNIYD